MLQNEFPPPVIPQEPIFITMFGSFQLRWGDLIVEDSGSRAHKLWSVLEYLVAFRNKDISHIELQEALWGDSETDNFANTLKSLIYRIRTLLTNSGLPMAKDLIVYKRGIYSWNNNVDTVVDCEVFEDLIKKASGPNMPNQRRIELYQKALALYKGDFLPNSAYEPWVIPLSTYYHNLYLKCVRETVGLLRDSQRHDEIIPICEAANIVEPFDEAVHEALIHAWVTQGSFQKALEHYEYVSKLFYQELGVKPSNRLRSIYRDIIKTVSHVETDMDIIKEDLRETILASNSFYCEYEVFKNIYRLEARSAARTGRSAFLALLTLSTQDQQIPDLKLLNLGMESLLKTICESLRRNDVVSRFSATQYVLMLMSLTCESGQTVLNRIITKFQKHYPHIPLLIHSNLQPLDPIICPFHSEPPSDSCKL